MTPEDETCSGLMWFSARSIPWSCRADAHVYNVRVGPVGWTPDARAGLVWLSFPLPPAAPDDFAHVQVSAERGDAIIFTVEVDGVVYPGRPGVV